VAGRVLRAAEHFVVVRLVGQEALFEQFTGEIHGFLRVDDESEHAGLGGDVHEDVPRPVGAFYDDWRDGGAMWYRPNGLVDVVTVVVDCRHEPGGYRRGVLLGVVEEGHQDGARRFGQANPGGRIVHHGYKTLD
jgi:hypothetical protein